MIANLQNHSCMIFAYENIKEAEKGSENLFRYYRQKSIPIKLTVKIGKSSLPLPYPYWLLIAYKKQYEGDIDIWLTDGYLGGVITTGGESTSGYPRLLEFNKFAKVLREFTLQNGTIEELKTIEVE